MEVGQRLHTAEEVAAANDQLRRQGSASGLGRVVATPTVVAHPRYETVMEAVREFSDFTPGNDPYGERDYGKVSVGGEDFMFKIDYYDQSLDEGADPYTDDSCVRILTVCYASEY